MKLKLIELLNLYENKKLQIGFKFVYDDEVYTLKESASYGQKIVDKDNAMFGSCYNVELCLSDEIIVITPNLLKNENNREIDRKLIIINGWKQIMKKFQVQAINLNQKNVIKIFSAVFDEDKDFYIFKNKNYFFRIRKINDYDYRLRVIRRVKYSISSIKITRRSKKYDITIFLKN